MSRSNEHIGLVAAGPRQIRSGLEYDKLFPTPDFQRTVLKNDGTIDETVFLMADYIKKYHKDTHELAQILKGKDLRETCDNIWSFVYCHIQYKLDKEGEEQLRRPALLWAYRHNGGDCDCMTIFVCSILYNLKIPFKIRITKYDGKHYFQHVYPIVPLDSGSYYTIDCVVSQFNYEKPFSEHKDFNMNTLGIPVVGLHGISSDFEELINGLGAIENPEQAVYNHLVKTREIITANPGIISEIDHEPAFLEMLDYAIRHFWHPTRDEAFKQLAWNEAILNQYSGVVEDDLLGIDDEDFDQDILLGFEDLDGVVDGDDVYDFDGLGRVKVAKKDRKTKRKQQKAQKKIQKAALKKNPKKAIKKIKKSQKKVAKSFFRKTGVVLAQKADKKVLIKHNPVILAKKKIPQDTQIENEEVQVDQIIENDVDNNENSQSEASDSSTNFEAINPEVENSEANEIEEDVDEQIEDDPYIDQLDLGDEAIEGLLGIKRRTKTEEQEIYQHLISTRNLIKSNPQLIQPEIDYSPGFLDMLNYAIKHYWTPQRDEALRVLAINEAKLNKFNGITDDDLLGWEDDQIEGIIDYDDIYEFNGLGELDGKEKRKKIKAERKAERKENKAKNKAERKNAKGFFRKVGVAVKQGGKTFKKFNPALIAIRNSFLLVMKINLFGLASKAKWGYATPEQVKAAGISDAIYNKSKKFVKQLEKLFADRAGGSRVSLKRNILTSKKARLGSIINLSGPEAAPVLAALPLITAVVKLLSENGLLSKKEANSINQKVKDKDINISEEDAKELENIQQEEAKNDESEIPQKSNSEDIKNKGLKKSNSNTPEESNGFFNTVLNSAKEHPILAVGALVLGSYLFIPPFKNFVNGILKIGKTTPTLSGCRNKTLEGIGDHKMLLAPKSQQIPKKSHELKFITLK